MRIDLVKMKAAARRVMLEELGYPVASDMLDETVARIVRAYEADADLLPELAAGRVYQHRQTGMRVLIRHFARRGAEPFVVYVELGRQDEIVVDSLVDLQVWTAEKFRLDYEAVEGEEDG